MATEVVVSCLCGCAGDNIDGVVAFAAVFNALLFGYNLMGYIDGSQSCPPKLGMSNHNSAFYTFWMRQDQLLLHAILAFVSDFVTTLIASAKASQEAWDKLNKLYAKLQTTLAHE
ncbi:hypothetical protein L1049_014197 [Liquidambar formosana]|uniref:Uncharacterized protein n=1 Tax=Liquidambar formosana TaxID=63359 RepID=A0AAP0RQK7_LIQFO